MKNKRKNIITGFLTIASVFTLFGFKLFTNSDSDYANRAYAANPGVSCSGVFFGDTDYMNAAGLTNTTLLDRFPAEKIVTSIPTINKFYGEDGNGKSIKYGSSSGKGELTLNLDRTVSGVKMGLKSWEGDTATDVIVNEIRYTIPSSVVYTDHLFEFTTPTNQVVFSAGIASKNRGFISYISFYY